MPLATNNYEAKKQYFDLDSVSGSAVIHAVYSSMKGSAANPKYCAMQLIHTGKLWFILRYMEYFRVEEKH